MPRDIQEAGEKSAMVQGTTARVVTRNCNGGMK